MIEFKENGRKFGVEWPTEEGKDGYTWKSRCSDHQLEVGKHYKIKGRDQGDLVKAQLGSLSFRVFELLEVLEHNNDDLFAKVRLKFKYCKISTCCCCDRTLTDEFSIQYGIGPVCGKKIIPNLKKLDNIRLELHRAAEALGEFECWIDICEHSIEQVEPEFYQVTQDQIVLGLLDDDKDTRELAVANMKTFVEKKKEIVTSSKMKDFLNRKKNLAS